MFEKYLGSMVQPNRHMKLMTALATPMSRASWIYLTWFHEGVFSTLILGKALRALA